MTDSIIMEKVADAAADFEGFPCAMIPITTKRGANGEIPKLPASYRLLRVAEEEVAGYRPSSLFMIFSKSFS